MPKERLKGIDHLRYNECYDMQTAFDELYNASKTGSKFHDLMDLILKENNILLAYHNIKINGGSKIPGRDGLTIKDISKLEPQQVIEKVRFILRGSPHGYRPKVINKKEISKPDGKIRTVGIPCIWDRLVQQCIKQVLEPICEARFSENSYGFRPNRSVENAIARTYRLLQMSNLHYVIEFNIKNFFDNIDHSKLIKQIWSLGIQDKELIYVIKRILKTSMKTREDGLVLPQKGITQSGILSPLLTNVVLNELDHWVESQWQYSNVTNNYRQKPQKNGTLDRCHGYRAMRESTKLKEMWIVRYADDFRIFCKTKSDAEKTKIAVEQWLEERLRLEISQEKTRIVNTRQKSMEFLGFSIKVRKKKRDSKYVVSSHISAESLKEKGEKLVKQVKEFCKYKDSEKGAREVVVYNAMVLGIQNYYRIATNVASDLNRVQQRTYRIMYNRLNTQSGSDLRKDGRPLTELEKKRFGNSKSLRYIAGTKEPIYPIYYVRFKNPMAFNRRICPYTAEGRAIIQDKSKVSYKLMYQLMNQRRNHGSVEYCDNRISLYAGQDGRCYVTGREFHNLEDMHCHHKIAKSKGGTDQYENLVLLDKNVHILIHSMDLATIKYYLELLQIKSAELRKLNRLRQILKLPIIIKKKSLSLSYQYE